MKVIRKEFQVDGHNGEFWIDVFTDTHIGSKSVSEKLLKRDIQRTIDDGHFAVHLGDCIDGIIPGDRRYDAQNLARWARESELDNRLIAAEWEYFEELFSPIGDKLLFVLDGDGKHNVANNIENCMATTLSRMNVIGGFPAAHCQFTFKRGNSTSKKTLEIFMQHMGACGRTDEAKSRYCRTALSYYPMVIAFFCGHGHGKVACRSECIQLEGGKQVPFVRRGAQCGSYLMTYAEDTVGYGERKAYPPVALGNVRACFRPFTKDFDRRVELFNL